jgi:hypothetical protein
MGIVGEGSGHQLSTARRGKRENLHKLKPICRFCEKDDKRFIFLMAVTAKRIPLSDT